MVCLDTSFVIDLLRGNNNIIKTKEKLDETGDIIHIPAPVIVELISGANLKGKKEIETKKIKDFLSTTIVLPLDKECAFLAGEIESELMQRGENIEIEDILIAAISIQNNETLVTRNEKHFRRIKQLTIEPY